MAANEAPPEVYYAVCSETDASKCVVDDGILAGGTLCYLPLANSQSDKAEQAKRSNCAGAKPIEEGVSSDGNTASRTGTLPHSPSRCPDPNNCIYLIVVKNQHSRGRSVSLMVSAEFNDPGDVLLHKDYQNVIR